MPRGNTFATFIDGDLELMSHCPLHEELKHVLTLLVYAAARATGISLKPMGNVTLREPTAGPGFEPDECFYRNARRGQFNGLTPEQMPPPDLAVEVEVSRDVLGRLPAFAVKGVAEVWRCDGEEGLRFMRLSDGEYREVPASRLLPGVTPEMVWGAATTLPDLDDAIDYQLAAAEFFTDRLGD